MNPDVSLLPEYVDTITQEIIASATVPSHLLKLAIECLLVIFESSFDMDCGPLVSALVRVQLDDHSLGVDMRELIVL